MVEIHQNSPKQWRKKAGSRAGSTRAAFVIPLLFGLIGCEPKAPPSSQESPVVPDLTGRPNILLILTDDQDAASLAFMPSVQEQLVAHGTTFTNSYSTTSLCCPARASILRGQYTHNHGVTTNRAPAGGFRRALELGIQSSTIATWLHDAGYRTAFIGKYLNEYDRRDARYVPPGWDEWQEFSAQVVSWLAHNGRVERLATPTDNTSLVAQRTKEFILAASRSGQPFFAFASFKAPHLPAVPLARHVGAFAAQPLPRPPSFNVPKSTGIPWVPHTEMTATMIAETERVYRSRLETLLGVDEEVGSMVALLDSLEILDNTVIIYTSDNGWFLGEHSIPAEKNLPYQESIRVPLVIRGPGVERAAQRHIALNIDLAPTIADYAGAAVPTFVDGRSLRGVLQGTVASDGWRTRFMTEHWRGDMVTRGLHDTASSYLEWANGTREYFSLATDPYELAPSIPPGASEDLRIELAAFGACAGTTCRALDGGP